MPLVPLSGLGALGLIADVAPQDVPVSNEKSEATGLTGLTNMRMRDGYAQRFGGLALAAPLTPPVAAPYWLQPFNTVSGRFWIHAGLASVRADDGTTQTNITGTPPTGAIDDRWTGGVLSGVLVMSNGIDVPQFWGGTGVLANLTGWDATWRCRALRPFKQYLVGVGWNIASADRPHLVKWSAAAEPGAVPTSWDEADPTLDAGEVDLAETPDRMVDMLPMGDANIIYKDQSMWSMRQSFGSSIFTFQRLPGDVGAIAPGCIADTPVGHVVMTYGDVIVHSGQGPRSILDGRMRKWLRARLGTENYRRSFVAVNSANSEVWICFPETGDAVCTMALVWNWQTSAIGVRDLPGVTYGAAGRMPITAPVALWSGASGTWDTQAGVWFASQNNASEVRLVMARASAPSLLLADQGLLDGASSFGATIERSGLSFGDAESVKTARGLYLQIDAVAGSELFVQIGSAMTAEEAPTYTAPASYIVGTTFKVDAFVTGRLLAFRIYSVGAFDWRIAGLRFDIVKRGRF